MQAVIAQRQFDKFINDSHKVDRETRVVSALIEDDLRRFPVTKDFEEIGSEIVGKMTNIELSIMAQFLASDNAIGLFHFLKSLETDAIRELAYYRAVDVINERTAEHFLPD